MKYRFLLLGWTLLWTTSLIAEPRVELEVSGLDKSLQDNVRAHLGIARLTPQSGLIPFMPFRQDQPAMAITESNVRRLHRKATEEIGQALITSIPDHPPASTRSTFKSAVPARHMTASWMPGKPVICVLENGCCTATMKQQNSRCYRRLWRQAIWTPVTSVPSCAS
jgi:hypothetical protein